MSSLKKGCKGIKKGSQDVKFVSIPDTEFYVRFVRVFKGLRHN